MIIHTLTTYSDKAISTLVESLDILEMDSLLEMLNTHLSPMKRVFYSKVIHLNSITRQYSQLDPVLSSMETLLYNSVIHE